MGYLEKESNRRRSKQNIQKAILGAIAISGILALAAVAPNATQLLKPLTTKLRKRRKEVIARSRQRLIEDGSLVYKDGFLRLTIKGQEKLRKFEIEDWKIDKPKKWDGRWRMLIFDIPERDRNVRNKIRQTLLYIGFIKVQQSVWLYPYDCEDLITLLKAEFKIGKSLLYLIVDSMENDKNFREIFHLPKIV